MQKFSRADWPSDTAARIQKMLDDGCTWYEIASSFGVSYQAVRYRAMVLGVFKLRNRFFTAEEDAVIRQGYLDNEDLDIVAARVGRTRGDIYQRILRKFPEILNTVRSPKVSRAVKRYGRDVLELGATPQEAAEVVKQRVIAASAAARVAAMQAKARRRAEAVALMMEKIAKGMDRNRAMFEARMLGLPLENIAACFDITRERVRQICDAMAFKDAMASTTNSASVGAA